jgi:EAL domain-containing protein (putative c-di-GMP-specific phosphodiesterase class I)
VEEVLLKTEIAPANLALEVTESALIEDWESASMMLKRLSRLGVQLHLDDFGTGFSSLTFLSQFNFDAIKIDRIFIKNFSQGNDAALIQSILALGANLKIDVIAEGIERIDQLSYLQKLKCPLGQGYYFYKPQDPASIESNILKDHNRPTE